MFEETHKQWYKRKIAQDLCRKIYTTKETFKLKEMKQLEAYLGQGATRRKLLFSPLR